MSDTKRIRYNGKGGDTVINDFGVWSTDDEKDVSTRFADRMIADGCFEEVAAPVTHEDDPES
jgi:hypothetical protein